MSKKKIKVTKKPIYSVEKDVFGGFTSKYTVEINGEEYSSVAKGRTEAEAFSNVRMSSARSLKASKYGREFSNVSDPDSILGSPAKSTPSDILNRQQNSSPEEDVDDQFMESAGISQQNYEATPSTSEDSENKLMVKGIPANHVPWYKKNGVEINGVDSEELREPRTAPFLRPDDVYILGNHNNHIILGRDYAPSQKNEKF